MMDFLLLLVTGLVVYGFFAAYAALVEVDIDDRLNRLAMGLWPHPTTMDLALERDTVDWLLYGRVAPHRQWSEAIEYDEEAALILVHDRDSPTVARLRGMAGG